MDKPHIGLLFEETIPNELFSDFESSISTDGLDVVIESRKPNGEMACIEWYIPAGLIAFISKSYFDGFLNEMGKEHYHLLKEKLSSLSKDVMENPRIEPTLYCSEGKLSSRNPFSLALSIRAEAEDGYTFQLMLEKGSSAEIVNKSVYGFLDFLNDYHMGRSSFNTIGYNSSDFPLPGHMVFVQYNIDSEGIEWLNHKEYR